MGCFDKYHRLCGFNIWNQGINRFVPSDDSLPGHGLCSYWVLLWHPENELLSLPLLRIQRSLYGGPTHKISSKPNYLPRATPSTFNILIWGGEGHTQLVHTQELGNRQGSKEGSLWFCSRLPFWIGAVFIPGLYGSNSGSARCTQTWFCIRRTCCHLLSQSRSLGSALDTLKWNLQGQSQDIWFCFFFFHFFKWLFFMEVKITWNGPFSSV